MADTLQNDPRNGRIAGLLNNTEEGHHAFAVRGIGPYGQDVLAHTLMAPNPAAALARIMTLKPVEAHSAKAWVVTDLAK